MNRFLQESRLPNPQKNYLVPEKQLWIVWQNCRTHQSVTNPGSSDRINSGSRKCEKAIPNECPPPRECLTDRGPQASIAGGAKTARLCAWTQPMDASHGPQAAARVKQVARPPLRLRVFFYGISGSKTSLLSTGFPSCPNERKIVPPPPKLLGML